jgi:hypothetical protein
MKVLDLQCAQGHCFEGWFGSEEDFQSQQTRALVQCPLCGDANIRKKLSAPRLNLSRASAPEPSDRVERSEGPAQPERADRSEQNDKALAVAGPHDTDMAKMWMEIGRHLMAHTTDVGQNFAEEARKIHYGEAPERGIRGQTSAREARELMEDGIGVLPFALPEALKGPLQ